MITFAYPDLVMPTALAAIPNAEAMPYTRPTRFHQTAFVTDAGTDAVFDFGSKAQVFTMALTRLTKPDCDAIKLFFLNAPPSGVYGRANPFVVRDAFGDSYRVRLAQDTIEPTMPQSGKYNINLTLRVVP